MARDFGVTNPEYLKVIEDMRLAAKELPQEYWDKVADDINKYVEVNGIPNDRITRGVD